MTSGILIILLGLATSPTSAAEPDLAEWLDAIAGQSPAELVFVETRESGLLNEPLETRGLLSRDGDRLIRQTEGPRGETQILADGHVELRRDGGYRQRFSLHRAPELAALREALLAILEGDIDRLQSHFEVELSIDADDAWSLSLHPRDHQLKERVSALELTGQGPLIEQMEMHLSDGDLVVTRFEDLP